MAKVVIFGTSQWAELAHFYLTHDSPHEVVAFTLDRDYLEEKQFKDLPVIAFDELEQHYPPAEYRLFIPISFKRMNHARAQKYEEAHARGYSMISYVSSKATIWPGFKCGENCFIFEDNTIQPFVTIGNNVVLWSGNHIGHHSQIKDHNFFTSHVVLSGHCVVNPHCFLGVNATIRDQVQLGEGTLVGMGANITRNTEPWSVYKADGCKPSKISSKDLDF